MRCPKCGYISFDHIEKCLKCKKDISGSIEVEGTTYNAVAPSFLRIPGEEDIESDMLEAVEFDDEDDAHDFSDPDLAILLDEDDDEELEGEITFNNANEDDFDNEDDFLFDVDADADEGSEESFDLADDSSETVATAQTTLTIPEELADISDLAPPEDTIGIPAPAVEELELSFDEELRFDEDTDLDGLDLDLGLSSSEDMEDTDFSFSLDDIDLSTEKVTKDDSDLDGLNMDMDLGAIGSPPAKSKDKSQGSLDGITLSLD